MNRALFLDRDGTLIEHIPYLCDPAQVKLCPGAKQALEYALQAGFKLFLFTNQSGIGRGMYTLEQAQACNTRMLELLGLGPHLFTHTCIAPEAPHQPSVYRKPSPQYILEQIAQHTLSPAQCYMIGDSLKDIQAAQAAGIQALGIDNRQLPLVERLIQHLPTSTRLYPDILKAIMSIDAS